MTEIRTQRVSLAGRVVEDLSYVPLEPGLLRAELIGSPAPALERSDGYFVFTDVAPGQYTLRLSAERFQPQEHPITIGAEMLLFSRPGDDELVVVVRSLNAGASRIGFEPLVLTRPIRAGSAVFGQPSVQTELSSGLEVGRVSEARLASLDGLAVGAVVRIVRSPTARLRLDPYHRSLAGMTHVAGRIVTEQEPQVPLADAEVRLTQVNGQPVTTENVAGVSVATVVLDGTRRVLGAEADISTRTNRNGDYVLYYTRGNGLQSVRLTATLAGYTPSSTTAPIQSGERRLVNIALARA